MYMWGYGAQGQLAQDNTTTISTPIQNIITNRSWVAIACGRNFTGGLETGFTGPTPSPTSSPSPTPSSTMTPTPSGTGPTFTPYINPISNAFANAGQSRRKFVGMGKKLLWTSLAIIISKIIACQSL